MSLQNVEGVRDSQLDLLNFVGENHLLFRWLMCLIDF